MDYYSTEALRELLIMYSDPPTDTPLSLVIARCVCGWRDSFSSPRESLSVCPSCSREIVTRNRDDVEEIINPFSAVN